MRLKVPFFKFGKKQPPEESEEEEIKRVVSEVVSKKEPAVVGAVDAVRLKTKPRIIFVGSSKGGCGKSFLVSNLVVVTAALSKHTVYAVDLDLDNYTLTSVLPPPNGWVRLEHQLQRSSGARYVNVADVIYEGTVKPGAQTVLIPRFSDRVLACTGALIEYSYRVIPAYDLLRIREAYALLQSVDPRLLRKGLEALITYFRGRINRGDDIVVFFDGKQKSDIGIEYEPLYRTLVDESDLFILVTEPPYLSFSEITLPYRRVLDKTVIVVNKADHPSKEQILLLVQDAVSNNVPVFLIPYLEEDGRIYTTKERRPPAAVRLNMPSALFIAALAYMINLVDEEGLNASGCLERVLPILRMVREINQR
ncbi:MAG: hypothetical protein QXM08_00900 [Thermofilaceae archaeon]